MVVVAIVGAGQMGLCIAGEMALHGHTVLLYDIDKDCLATALSRLDERKQQLHSDGLLSRAQDLDGVIQCSSDLQHTVANAAFVFEAVVEDIDVKKQVCQEIDKLCGEDVPVCSSTININMSDITKDTNHPERFLGVRFLFPVHGIPEVELTTTAYVKPVIIAKIKEFLKRIGKHWVHRQGTGLKLTQSQVESRQQAYRDMIRRGCTASSYIGYGHAYHSDMSVIPSQKVGLTQAQAHVHMQCTSSKAAEAEGDPLQCIVCMNSLRDVLLCPCNHYCVCDHCACLLKQRNAGCPVCRGPIKEHVHVYSS